MFNCPANLASHRRWHRPNKNSPLEKFQSNEPNKKSVMISSKEKKSENEKLSTQSLLQTNNQPEDQFLNLNFWQKYTDFLRNSPNYAFYSPCPTPDRLIQVSNCNNDLLTQFYYSSYSNYYLTQNWLSHNQRISPQNFSNTGF